MKLSLSRGFTLLEMMFIVILVAVISLYAINFSRQHTANQSASETAAQMLEWLQASQTYYVQNSMWPQSTNGDGGWTVLNNANLLPATVKCSKIIQNSSNTSSQCGLFGMFTIGYAQGYAQNGQPYNYQSSPYISISTPVADASLAQAIATKLPNGQYVNGQVIGYANIPGVSLYPNQYRAGVVAKVIGPTDTTYQSGYTAYASSGYYQMYGGPLFSGNQPLSFAEALLSGGGSEFDIIITNKTSDIAPVQLNTGAACSYYGAYQYPTNASNPFTGNLAQCNTCTTTSNKGSGQCKFPGISVGESIDISKNASPMSPPSACTIGALTNDNLNYNVPNNSSPDLYHASAGGFSGPAFINVFNKTTGPHAANIKVTMSSSTPSCLVIRNINIPNVPNPFVGNTSVYTSFMNGYVPASIPPSSSLVDVLYVAGIPWWAHTTNPVLSGVNIYTMTDNSGFCNTSMTLSWTDPVTGLCYQAQYAYGISSSWVWPASQTSNNETAVFCQAQLYQTQPPTEVKCP